MILYFTILSLNNIKKSSNFIKDKCGQLMMYIVEFKRPVNNILWSHFSDPSSLYQNTRGFTSSIVKVLGS